MRKLIFSFLVFLTISSCARKEETTYRIVGKNGKAIYLDKKIPASNKKYTKNISEKNNSDKDSNYLNENSKTVTINNNNENFNNITDSSAYALSSVMDGTIKYNSDIINSSAQDIGNKTKYKTIVDFDYLPKSYFILDGEKATVTNIKKKQNKTNSITQTQKNNTKINSKTINETPIATFIGRKMYYTQLGFFVNKEHAIKLKNEFNDIDNINIVEAKNNNGNIIYKVIVGSFENKKDAENIAKIVKNRGHEDVYIFEK